MKTITVIENQNLWDISLQEYGDIEAVFYIVEANPLLKIDSEIASGQKINIPDITPLNKDVVNYYNSINYKPTSGSFIFTPTIIPPPTPPPNPGADAIVHNSDNSLNTTVPSGGTLNLTDSVITINGILLSNLPATNNLDVEVVNDNDDPIGEMIGGKLVVSDEWKRNSEWLPIVDPSTEDKFVGLLAVYPNGRNDLTMRYSAIGGYTVDWGDGTITTHGSNTNSTHSYDYSTINNSTLTSEGYKQVIVTVTPTITSNSFTGLLGYSYVNNVPINWLDLVVQSPFITRFYGYSQVIHPLLERFRVVGVNPSADYQYLFFRAPKISVVEIDYSLATNLFVLFGYSGIKKIGNLNVTCEKIPNFYYATALKEVGSYTCLGTQFNSNDNSPIEIIGDVNCPNATISKQSFKTSRNLRKIGFMNFPNVTDASEMFRQNYSLNSFNGNFDSVQNIRYMFEDCPSLRSVTFSDLSNVNSVSALFSKCYSLAELRVPNIATTFDLSNCNLDRAALVQVFNDLGTTTATLTITGNIGVASLTSTDLLIATNKGWTIVQ